MTRILVAVDGSAPALRAVQAAARLRQSDPNLELHLLNVQIPAGSGHARLFVDPADVEAYHRAEGNAALQEARAWLDAAEVSYQAHVAVGHAAETIASFARERAVDQIFIGSRGTSMLSDLLLGSIASEVIRRADQPVTVVK